MSRQKQLNALGAMARPRAAGDGGRLAGAFCVALVLELGGLALLARTGDVAPPAARREAAPIQIVLVAPPAAAARPAVLALKPPRAAAPPPLPSALPLPPPAPPAATRVAEAARPRPRMARPAGPPVAAAPAAPSAAPPLAAPSAAVASAGEVSAFAAAINRALAAALVFPVAARLAGEHGTVGIRFSYLDGAVTAVAVVRSCGFATLDAAAVATARTAHYPPPPPAFAGRAESLVASVVFPRPVPDIVSD